MYNFKGISPQTIQLLCENRFQDSKPFYEAHKEEIKQGAVVPMRQIMLDLSGQLCELDDKMYTNPLYTVSRVRRDTRRTKSKLLYRENLWVMFRRNKFEYPNAPFMWFEFNVLNFPYYLTCFAAQQGVAYFTGKKALAHNAFGGCYGGDGRVDNRYAKHAA